MQRKWKVGCGDWNRGFGLSMYNRIFIASKIKTICKSIYLMEYLTTLLCGSLLLLCGSLRLKIETQRAAEF